MTIKLTQQQAEALYQLFNAVILPVKPVDIAESLIYDLMVRVYKKLRNRLESEIKKGYSVTLTPEEAKAYYVYFNQRTFGTSYQYEQIFIQVHINEIDKIYA